MPDLNDLAREGQPVDLAAGVQPAPKRRRSAPPLPAEEPVGYLPGPASDTVPRVDEDRYASPPDDATLIGASGCLLDKQSALRPSGLLRNCTNFGRPPERPHLNRARDRPDRGPGSLPRAPTPKAATPMLVSHRKAGSWG